MVAEEVRKLADSSGKATKRIDELILAMTTELESVLAVTRVSSGVTASDAEAIGFARVTEMTHEVLNAGEHAVGVSIAIADIADKNRAAAQLIGETGHKLETEIFDLQTLIEDHDRTATLMLEQAESTQGLILEIAAISKETSTATTHVTRNVHQQFEGLSRLTETARRVSGSAETAYSLLNQFRTESPDQETEYESSDGKMTLVYGKAA